jgi:hypothetical protein
MKKIIIISGLVAILIILGGLSPSIVSKDIVPIQLDEEIETITVEVNKYYGKQETIYTDLTFEEIEELEKILTILDEAILKNDEKTIKECEKSLNEKGIFGDKYENFYSHDFISKKFRSSRLSKFSRILPLNGDDLSNLMCYFHARGQGMFFFFAELNILQNIVDAMNNASGLIEAFIIFFALLPIYVMIMLLTHVVPFRILMPKGICRMDDGKMTSIGLKGVKTVEATSSNESVMLNLSFFTGITISWPIEDNNILFVSGFAVSVSEPDF